MKPQFLGSDPVLEDSICLDIEGIIRSEFTQQRFIFGEDFRDLPRIFLMIEVGDRLRFIRRKERRGEAQNQQKESNLLHKAYPKGSGH